MFEREAFSIGSFSKIRPWLEHVCKLRPLREHKFAFCSGFLALFTEAPENTRPIRVFYHSASTRGPQNDENQRSRATFSEVLRDVAPPARVLSTFGPKVVLSLGFGALDLLKPLFLPSESPLEPLGAEK